MNPASTINRGATRSISPASAASNSSRLEKRRCSTRRVATPRAAAVSRPLASASLLMTVVIGSAASSNACRLLPRPEMSTATDMNRSVDPRRSVAVFLEQREHALASIQVQRAERDEGRTAPQFPLHAEGHHDAAIMDHALRHHRLVRGDLGMAGHKFLAQLPDRRQIARQVSVQRAFGEHDQLIAVGQAVFQERDLRLHRELIEGEDLLLNLLDLQKWNAASASELEQLDVERRPVLPGGAAQVEEHAPWLEPVDELARQPDRLQMLHRALEVLRPDLLFQRLVIEEQRRFQEALLAVCIGHEFQHQAFRAVERSAHNGRQFGESRVRYMDGAKHMTGRDTLLRHAPEQAAREALIRRRPGGNGRKQKARKKKSASIHDPGPIIASGRTQRSKSSALTWPSAIAASRNVVPSRCAFLAISAARS